MLTCPQCGQTADSGRLRLVQDTCGHRKCRECLLSDEASCWSCASPVYTELQPVSAIAPPECLSPLSIPLETTAPNLTTSHAVQEQEQTTLSPNHRGTTLGNPHSDVNSDSEKSQNSFKNIGDKSRDTEVKECHSVKKRQHLGLKEHIIFTPGDPPMYHCKVCRKSYNNRKAARYHNYCGLPDNFKPHQCDICGQGFVTSGHFAYHMKSHSGSLPFLCEICKKGFKQSSKLKRHMKSHEGEKSHKCEVCNRFFSAKHVLKDHMMIHTGNHVLSCPVCCKKFSSKSCLRKHRLLHSDPTHKCDDCGKKFPVKWNLDMHRKTHARERRHKCKQCNRAFKILSDLKRHATVHLEDGEWICKVCKIVFRRKDNLIRHMKNIHPDIQTNSGHCLQSTPKLNNETVHSKDPDKAETSSPAPIPQAVSVIRGRAVPVIQKNLKSSARPFCNKASAVQIELPVKLLDSSPNHDSLHLKVSPCSSGTTSSSSLLQEENSKVQYNLRRNQNFLRESVVCHSDARGVVHCGSVMHDNASVFHELTDVIPPSESEQSQFSSNTVHSMQSGHGKNECTYNSINRPRVIVEKAQL